MPVLQAEAQADDLALALGQAVEHLRQLLLQHAERGGVGRHHGGVVLDEVAQLGVLLLADGRLERHGLLRDLLDLAHALGGRPISLPISSGLGSRPSSWSSWRWMRTSLLMVSTMCTGMRMVRAWSAMARVMAWRIHQVAYVENLKPFV